MSESTKQTENPAENGNKSKPMLANRLYFKAWNNELKSMSKPFTFGQVLNFNDKNIKSITDEKILQFIGLQDKNGNEICEGDILKFMHHLHKVFRVKGGLVINSHLDDFYKDYTPFWESCSDMQTSQWISQCKIIGNIFQNPELLQTTS